MKRFGITFGFLFITLAGYLLVFNLTPPTFHLSQRERRSTSVLITIKPNFVVNSLRKISVVHSDEVILSQNEVHVGSLVITVPGGFDAGDTLMVSCDLQFDQWVAPCITTIKKQIVLQ